MRKLVLCFALLAFPASAETITYKYDALGRIVAACWGGQAKHMAFSYDAAGNRSAVAVAASCYNQPPVALDDAVTGNFAFNQQVPVYVLANDGDQESGVLTVTATSCASGSGGCSVSIAPGGTHIVVTGDTAGTKTVNYTVSDGTGATDQGVATVGVFINPCPGC